MTETERKLFEILENMVILFQSHLPSKILKTREFQEIKNKLESLQEKKIHNYN